MTALRGEFKIRPSTFVIRHSEFDKTHQASYNLHSPAAWRVRPLLFVT
jgi:hypothetical protein